MESGHDPLIVKPAKGFILLDLQFEVLVVDTSRVIKFITFMLYL